MFWFKYFIPNLDNPIDWKEFDSLIVKIGKLGAEYQDFGRKGRCYRIPIASAVYFGIQGCLDESWKNTYPLVAMPKCLINIPWQKVEREPEVTPERHLNKMSADFKTTGKYKDPDGVEWTTGDGILNYWNAHCRKI
jgi:hypothetical protein